MRKHSENKRYNFYDRCELSKQLTAAILNPSFIRLTIFVRIVTALALLSGIAALSHGQDRHGAVKVASPPQAMAEHRAALVAQCRMMAIPPNAQDLPIHVTFWGATGPKVLLIHGGAQGNIGGGPATFVHQEALSKMGWRVERVDRPGFGESPFRGPDNMDTDAVFIANMLGDGANLIGHSFGGADALLAAGLRPEAVRALILVEPGLNPLLGSDPSAASNEQLKKSAATANSVLMDATSPAQYATATVRNFGTDGHGGPSQAVLTMQEHPESAASLGCAILTAHFASAERMQTAANAIVKAGIPVLVITGGYNPGRDAADEVFARLLHGKYVVVKSPNHFVQQSNPEEFNRVVDAFMRQADAPTRSQTAARP